MILQRLDQKHKEHNTVEYVGKPKDEDFWKTGDFHDLHVETSFQPPGRRGFGQSEAPLGIWCYNTCFSRDAPAIKCLTWRRSETEVSSEGSSNSCWNVRAIFLPARKKGHVHWQFSQVPDPPVADLSCLLSSHPALILSVASGTGVMPVTVPIYNRDRWKKGEKRVRKVTTVGRQNECVKPFSPLSRMIVGPQKKDNIFYTCLLVLIPWDLPGA